MLIKFSLRESDLYIDAQSPLSWMGIHITRKFVSVKILQPLPRLLELDILGMRPPAYGLSRLLGDSEELRLQKC